MKRYNLWLKTLDCLECGNTDLIILDGLFLRLLEQTPKGSHKSIAATLSKAQAGFSNTSCENDLGNADSSYISMH